MELVIKDLTIEEVIEWFKENPFYHKDHIPFNMAIKALEKQMPQKPIIENGFVKCPKCKMYIRFPIADKYNNCPECGQAIKWEESEVRE